MRRLFFLAAVLAFAHTAAAQQGPIFATEELDVLEAEFVDHNTQVLPPPMPPGALLRPAGVEFQVDYEDFPPEALAPFELALAIWSDHIASPVPIRIRARFVNDDRENVLGSAGPQFIANFTRALDIDTWYPTAVANALEGRILNPDTPDISTNFNANFPNWYFGTDGAPPDGQWDFVTVAMHEIGHGLGFVGTMRVSDENIGRWGLGGQGFPAIYDRFTETDFRGETSPLINPQRFPNPSVVLAEALTSTEVYFVGQTAVRAHIDSQTAQGLAVGPRGRPKLHAPREWRPGSSYSHLTELREGGEERYYPPGSINSLMTPRLGATEVIHTPGPITCGMFRDMGWQMGPLCEALLPPEPPPLEEPLLVVGPCPNPAVGGQTFLQVYVREQSRVRVDLFDMVGRRVQRVFDGLVQPVPPFVVGGQPLCLRTGSGAILMATDGLASGVYLARVIAEDEVASVRVTVIN